MFTINGYVGSDRVLVTWWEPDARMHLTRPGARSNFYARNRGIESDDGELVTRILLDEGRHVRYRITPEGPTVTADLNDPVAAYAQITSYFEPEYEVSGYPPRMPIEVPVGAIP